MKTWTRALPAVVCALLWAPERARAVDDCPGCVLGIWDDDHLTRNYGYSSPDTVKIIYVGMGALAAADLFNNIEFSIAGLRAEDGIFVVAVSCAQDAHPTCIGSVASPADTSITSVASGGLVTNWFDCFGGSRPLIAVALVHVEPQPDHVLQVKRKYPTSNPAWQTPVARRCQPGNTAVRVRGGCYVLNPTPGQPSPCALENVARTAPTWSQLKNLYRR